MKITLLISTLIFSFWTISCKKTDGFAPSSQAPVVTSIKMNSLSYIVPKSTTFKASVIGTYSDNSESEITSSSTCTTSNPIAKMDKNGNLSNSYSGNSIQRLTLTCTYNQLSITTDITIVPAVLISLVLTKNSLQMGPNQNTSIQVYGNFQDTNLYVFALEMTNYITWSSTSSSVASGALGTISSGTTGSANITASFAAITVSTSVTVSNATASPVATPKGVGLLGSYYDFGIAAPTSVPWLAGTIGDPFEVLFGQRIDSQVYFNWSTGVNNLGQLLYFGIRWTGKIYIPTTGTYTFFTNTDDGVRLWVNDTTGSPIINNWTLHSAFEDSSAGIILNAGQFYDIKMDYFENAGYSKAELYWQGPGIGKQLVPQIYLFPN